MNNKNLFKGGIVALLLVVNVITVFADHQEGTVTRVHWQPTVGGQSVQLHVSVDTTGNRIADTIVRFVDDYVADGLKEFIEKGMKITFDDEDYELYNGMKYVAGSNTKTIDGENMLVLFPNEAARFKFAAKARLQSNKSRNNSTKSIFANVLPFILPQPFRRNSTFTAKIV